MSSKLNELQGLGNGVWLVLKSFVDLRSQHAAKCLADKNFQNDLEHFRLMFEDQFSRMLSKSPDEQLRTVYKKGETLLRQTNILFKSDLVNKYMPQFFTQKRAFSVLNNYNSRPSIYSSLYLTQSRHGSDTASFVDGAKNHQTDTKQRKPLNEGKYTQKVRLF